MFEILQQRHLPAGIISTFPTLGFYGWLRLLSEHGTITLAKAGNGWRTTGFHHGDFMRVFQPFSRDFSWSRKMTGAQIPGTSRTSSRTSTTNLAIQSYHVIPCHTKPQHQPVMVTANWLWLISRSSNGSSKWKDSMHSTPGAKNERFFDEDGSKPCIPGEQYGCSSLFKYLNVVYRGVEPSPYWCFLTRGYPWFHFCWGRYARSSISPKGDWLNFLRPVKPIQFDSSRPFGMKIALHWQVPRK